MRRGRGEPGGAGSARSAPVIKWVVGGSRRPMAARTSGWSSGRNGMAASGQTTAVTPARLSTSPAVLAAESCMWSRKMRRWFSGRHFSRCGTLGWTMRIFTPGTRPAAPHQAHLAEQRHDGQRSQCDGECGDARAVAGGSGRGLTPQYHGEGKDEDGDEGQSVDAQKGRALHQRQGVGERVAQHIPGQAGEDGPRAHSMAESAKARTRTRAGPWRQNSAAMPAAAE